jgi:catechol 2,3-dioxygenase-like lactoylglutathione lyase family enzyme
MDLSAAPRQTTWSVDHVGFTVPDLDEAVAFFCEALGCQLVLQAGPYENVGYVWPGEDSPEQANLRLAILNHRGLQNIELLEYRSRPNPPDAAAPRPADRGGAHICFFVDDVEGAVTHLSMWEGVRVLGAVDTETEGPLKGQDWVFVLTRWGLVIELVNWKPGMPYERTTSARLVSPPQST